MPSTTAGTPASIVLVRILVAIQVVAGLFATALLGLYGMVLLVFVGATDGTSAFGAAGVVVLALLAVVVFMLIALARAGSGLRRGSRSEHTRLLVAEGSLVGVLVLILLRTHGFALGSGLGALSSVPLVVLATGTAIMTLLASPGARAWTSER